MGSKLSKARCPISNKSKAVIVPQDIINEILDHLASDFRSLRACTLISKPWVQPCQRHLFHTARFTSVRANQWLRIFPVREGSPAHYVKEIRLEIGSIRHEFFECMPWFTDVDEIYLGGHFGGVPLGSGRSSPSEEPSFWKLPRSATSLTISTTVIALVQVRDIMAQLPNLDSLALSASISDVVGRRGIGTVLKGRFGGKLMLRGPGEGIANMLLEIPSGLHFTELEVYCPETPLPSSVIRLAGACRETLVKLSHIVPYHCKSYNLSGCF